MGVIVAGKAGLDGRVPDVHRVDIVTTATIHSPGHGIRLHGKSCPGRGHGIEVDGPAHAVLAGGETLVLQLVAGAADPTRRMVDPGRPAGPMAIRTVDGGRGMSGSGPGADQIGA